MPGVSSYNTEPAMVRFNLKLFFWTFYFDISVETLFLLSANKFMKQYILRKT